MEHDEILVSIHYRDNEGGIPGDVANEVPAEDMLEALDIASNIETWRDASGRDIGFVLIWDGGDAVATFHNQDEALTAFNDATGRC